MDVARDVRTLYHLVVTRHKGATHQQRLEHFYRGQATDYDRFRRKLLHGRDVLFAELASHVPAGATWVDFGAGTGENLERASALREKCEHVYLVDLARPLLDVAEARAQAHGWDNVHCTHADATQFTPPSGRVDVVTFSYSLTMIPPWFRALSHARTLLKPGGHIGVTDFYVSRKYPEAGSAQHSLPQRTFWPFWFGLDNVFLSSDHLPFLLDSFEPVYLVERTGKVPYLLGLEAPYYAFVGQRPA